MRLAFVSTNRNIFCCRSSGCDSRRQIAGVWISYEVRKPFGSPDRLSNHSDVISSVSNTSLVNIYNSLWVAGGGLGTG